MISMIMLSVRAILVPLIPEEAWHPKMKSQVVSGQYVAEFTHWMQCVKPVKGLSFRCRICVDFQVQGVKIAF